MRYVLLLMMFFMASCAKPHVVDIVQPYDEELNCAALKNEIAKLDKFIEDAEAEKGVTGGNAGRLLVFPIVIWFSFFVKKNFFHKRQPLKTIWSISSLHS